MLIILQFTILCFFTVFWWLVGVEAL